MNYKKCGATSFTIYIHCAAALMQILILPIFGSIVFSKAGIAFGQIYKVAEFGI